MDILTTSAFILYSAGSLAKLIHFEVALLLIVVVDDIVDLVIIFVVGYIWFSYCQ